jgi:hypothetical protein
MAMHLVPMPPEGLFRGGRWEGIDTFPLPAPEIPPESVLTPLTDGPRWEDFQGRFATVKFSKSAEAAIGRTIARYRRRTIASPVDETPGATQRRGIIDLIKDFMNAEPDLEDEPELVDGIVPADLIADLYVLHMPYDPALRFVDIEHPATLSALQEEYGHVFAQLGLGSIENNNLARAPDRRLTRLVLRFLYQMQHQLDGPVAGVRVPGQPDGAWESFVVWSPPEMIDMTAEDVAQRWVASWDDDLMKAANTLGLQIPE